MKKAFKFSFIGILLIFILLGCGQQSEQKSHKDDSEDTPDLKDELKVAYPAQPASLDPYLTTAIATSDVLRGVYETLVTVDADNEFQPMLADSYEFNEDGTEITFHLRKGVLFHNGEEMKADDVVASMNQWQKYSNRASAFQEASFEKIDDYTVLLTLNEPISTALSVLSGMQGSFAAIMPKSIIDEATETGVQEIIGTGPYEFVEWKQDSYIHTTKFDDYQSRTEEASGLAGKKEALIKDVYFHIVTDHSTRVAGILSGEYDIIHATPYDQAEILDDNEDVENHLIPGNTLVMIMNKNMELFQDVEVRKAIRLGLDEDEIMRGAFTDEKYYTLNHNMVKPHLLNRFNTDIGKAEYEAFDPETAKARLEELGVFGEEIIIITTRDYDDQYTTSLVLQQQLENLGFDVELDIYDWPTLIDKTYEEQGYHINIMGWGPQPEPTSYGFLRPGQDSGWITDQAFFELIDDFRRQPTLEDTEEAYDAIMQWMTDEVPLIKLGDSNRIVTISKNVNNFQFQDGFIVWNMTVTK